MAEQELITFSPIDSGTIINIILVFVIAYVLIRIITFALIHISERIGRYRITVKMVIPVIKFLIYSIALYHVLSNILELSSQQLIVFGGLFGAAIGFGIKDLFAGALGGLVIMLEKPYRVGDKIKIGGYYGEVTDIGLIATKLVTPDDDLVSAPNYLIFTQAVASANAGNTEMMVVIDLFVDHNSDIASAMKILKDALVTSKYVYITSKRPVTVFVKEFPFYKRLRAKAYVNDLRYEFLFESDVTMKTLAEFAKNEIAAPEMKIIENYV
jgi:small-conductance mechanosensitive channel